jgi:glycosyltransferase involved in cell wall biosynthesis
MNITYLITDKGGCSYYRAMMPLDMLHEQKLAEVMRVEKGDNADRVSTALAEADVVLFPRISAHQKVLSLSEELKKDGKLVVADYDDNIWKVTPLSPHYADYGMVEYQHVIYLEGKKVRLDVWKDNVTEGFSIKKNRERLESVKQVLGMVDLVTTTTEILADVLRRYNPNVAVLPNCVDLKRWNPIALKPHDEIRLFWAGSSSHFEDWQILGQVLPAVMDRFPRTKLVLMGVKFSGLLKNLPSDRVEFHLWEDNLSYPYKCAMLAADLCLIPLVDNPFNRCKSAIKWIEQSALGVPSVVSYVSPYAEIYNGENAVMVKDNDPEAWIEAISTMIREPMLRAKIGGEAQRYVQSHYDIRQRAVEWMATYDRHLPRKQEEEAWQLAKSGT